jgi:hypothetical protein
LRAIGSKHLLIEFTAEPDLNISLSKLETKFTKVFNEIVQQGSPEKTIKQIKKRFQGHLNDVLKRKNYRKNLLIDRVSNHQPYYGLTAERRALRSVTAQKINDLFTALGQSGCTVIYRANELWKRKIQVIRCFLIFATSMLLSCQEDDLNADASDEPRPAEFKMLPEENRSVILATTPLGHTFHFMPIYEPGVRI